ncbi:GNAT family N-acetyltransferase [Roseomonas sp. 18066]|uniref:GNAT family N-acetyltransferase n=1 Tax=Roseomonas sp. 18066 TaxID=2681412 RepID=UPI00135AECBF|nr:GNAT family N-acetyltransferase [Roseomonas sp. 18066]
MGKDMWPTSFCRLEQAWSGLVPPGLAATLRHRLALSGAPPMVLRVAFLGGTAGAAVAVPQAGGGVELIWLGVRASLRRRGIGASLLRAVRTTVPARPLETRWNPPEEQPDHFGALMASAGAVARPAGLVVSLSPTLASHQLAALQARLPPAQGELCDWAALKPAARAALRQALDRAALDQGAIPSGLDPFMLAPACAPELSLAWLVEGQVQGWAMAAWTAPDRVWVHAVYGLAPGRRARQSLPLLIALLRRQAMRAPEGRCGWETPDHQVAMLRFIRRRAVATGARLMPRLQARLEPWEMSPPSLTTPRA